VNFSLDKFRQQRQRFLPAEVASLRWYGRGHPFLRDVQFGSAEYLPQRNRRLHFSGQVRIVELVRVADAFGGRQFAISSAERVALAGAEISERHLAISRISRAIRPQFYVVPGSTIKVGGGLGTPDFTERIHPSDPSVS
jgi:hypothetical protein